MLSLLSSVCEAPSFSTESLYAVPICSCFKVFKTDLVHSVENSESLGSSPGKGLTFSTGSPFSASSVAWRSRSLRGDNTCCPDATLLRGDNTFPQGSCCVGATLLPGGNTSPQLACWEWSFTLALVISMSIHSLRSSSFRARLTVLGLMSSALAISLTPISKSLSPNGSSVRR